MFLILILQAEARQIEIKNVDPVAFRRFLQLLYTGSFSSWKFFLSYNVMVLSLPNTRHKIGVEEASSPFCTHGCVSSNIHFDKVRRNYRHIKGPESRFLIGLV